MTNEGIIKLARMAAMDLHLTNNGCITDAEYAACWAAVEAGVPLPDCAHEESCMDAFRREELYEEVIGTACWLEHLMKRARDE